MKVGIIGAGHASVSAAIEAVKNRCIKLCLNTKIVEIHKDKSIKDDQNNKYKFDLIIVATGSKPKVPSVFHNVLIKDYVSTLWTMDDALKINSKVNGIKNLIIIGGGVIGIETALMVRDLGMKPVIVDHNSRPLKKTLTNTTSESIYNYLNENGIDFIPNCKVENISKTLNRVKVVTDKENLCTDFVVFAIGVTANINYDCDCHEDKKKRCCCRWF